MFLEFWKLREQPFGVTPDPRYLYFSPGHREALASLFYGIETGRGFLSLVAQPGMGKTTLLFQLLRRWKGHIHSAFLFQTQCSSRELVRYLLADLGLKNDGEDMVRMHSELNDFLFRETKAGRRVVVFIDEAHNLSTPVLETVRLLSNFEAPDKKLMQIVLTGQPELAQRLSHPELAQLRQRIAVQTQLDPLSPVEVARYVNHRLQVAGYQGQELFTSPALDLVARYSGGIPRLINVLCFNALSLGFAGRHNQISPDIVREAAKDVALDAPEPAPVTALVEKPQAVAPELQESVSYLYSWITKTVRRPLVQVSALYLLFCMTALYLAAHSRGVSAHRSIESKVNTNAPPPALHPDTPVSQSTPVPSAATPSAAVVPPESGRAGDKSLDSVISYVVQPHDTMVELCLSTFGRYDEVTLNEILRLNPRLKNPNHLEVGQEIRLPRTPQKPVASKAFFP
jgi:type II secretory pathway predicted ATPase ExeA